MMEYLKLTLAMTAFFLLLTLLVQTESCRSMKAETPAPTVDEQTRKPPVGIWGGKSALLNVHEKGAGLELACAHGSIEQPLILDRDGAFDAAGTYEQESLGPQAADEKRSQPARYIGNIQARKMTLTIKLTQTKETIGPLILSFGQMTMLQKCQ